MYIAVQIFKKIRFLKYGSFKTPLVIFNAFATAYTFSGETNRLRKVENRISGLMLQYFSGVSW